MNLTDQVCSLDLAKRLKELGVKQESLFHWITEQRQGRARKTINVYRNSLGLHWIVAYDIEKSRGQHRGHRCWLRLCKQHKGTLTKAKAVIGRYSPDNWAGIQK